MKLKKYLPNTNRPIEDNDMKIQCKNVAGGWQTCVVETGYQFGPVFNKITDLWAWQRENLFGIVEGYVAREAA